MEECQKALMGSLGPRSRTKHKNLNENIDIHTMGKREQVKIYLLSCVKT